MSGSAWRWSTMLLLGDLALSGTQTDPGFIAGVCEGPNREPMGRIKSYVHGANLDLGRPGPQTYALMAVHIAVGEIDRMIRCWHE
jgi:hypothetical protein